jgi:hypothetical protein
MILDPLLTRTVQLFLAILLIAAALHKSADPGRMRAAISAYRVVPVSSEDPVAWLVIGLEMAVGAALLVPILSKSASLAAAGVFAVYFALMSLSLVRGDREMNCGCSFSRQPARLSSSQLVRNSVLVMLAVVAWMPDSGRVVGWIDGLQIAAAASCLTLIYLSVDSLLVNAASLAGEHTK